MTEGTAAMVESQTALAKTFDVDLPAIRTKVAEFLEMTLPAGDTDAYGACKKGLMVCVHTRTGIDKKRLASNASDQIRIKTRNTDAKTIAAIVAPAEDHLSGVIKTEDDRLEAIRAEKASELKEVVDERIGRLMAVGCVMSFQDVAALDEDGFLETLAVAELVHQEKLDADAEAEHAKKIEEVRLEKQKADQEAEADRLADIAKEQKKEQDRIAAEQKEAQDKIDAAQKEIDDEKARIANESAEKLAAIDAQARAEEEKNAEADRKAQEQVDHDEKKKSGMKRQERLKPDKNKMGTYTRSIRSFVKDDDTLYSETEVHVLHIELDAALLDLLFEYDQKLEKL